MAVRKMTFSLPEDVAAQFVERVPARRRSSYLAQLIRNSFQQQEQEIARACWLTNEDADGRALETELDQMDGGEVASDSEAR
ncbi:MAG: hypothetical protein GY953_47860 [bacterium]|nr:hypothetical protein [bacterium]